MNPRAFLIVWRTSANDCHALAYGDRPLAAPQTVGTLIRADTEDFANEVYEGYSTLEGCIWGLPGYLNTIFISMLDHLASDPALRMLRLHVA